ncbi:conserved hypothetical membrane protein [Kluyveromyces marxianus DMKU3-1042]|uniref:Conserved hypothetical membrane protein n=1 Tax=Kluyveromyces marxianus (strain DMKU3-1042 / BCC 29191 / NBRC 104275) TaxID=1003335 RepID=W0TE73_KLUMD|nr:conserved hypothetical membrane protein [Kluyveromyces marxianus DMKU3-1042]BAO41937.1 conserved hypothetical membrane protein [Kluyveromyces marxianus DMKU3-1042]
MAFFHHNPVFDFFHRVMRKPSSIVMWLFSGLIVASTLATIWSLPAVPDSSKSTSRESSSDSKSKSKDALPHSKKT